MRVRLWHPSSTVVLPVEAEKGSMEEGAMESVGVEEGGKGDREATRVGDVGAGLRTGGRRAVTLEGVSLVQ